MDRTRLTRAACFAAGAPVVGVGVSVLLRSGTGVAPFDVTNSGVAAVTGWDVGTASWVVSVVLLAAAVIAGRRPRPGTVVATLAIGAVVNLALAHLEPAQGPPAQLGYALAGMSLMWVGIVALVCADFGAGPAEELMLALVARSWPLREVRWGIEAALAAVGWLMGGALGVSTLVFVVCTGPVLAWAIPRSAQVLRLSPHLPGPGVPAELR